MDEYLSEKEQIEQIREWWRENGWYLIGGVVVAGLGYFGYNEYQGYRQRQAALASALYTQMQQLVAEDRIGVEDTFDELVADYPGSPYTDQARLLLARELLVSDTDRAAAELRTVMESSADPQLSLVARLRLARVLEYQEDFDAALALLAVDEPGEFAAQMKSIEGDIHVARGAEDDARAAYAEALTLPGAAGLDRNLLQMKLAEILPPVPDGSAAVAPAGAAAAAAGSSPADDTAGGDDAGGATGAGADTATEAAAGADAAVGAAVENAAEAAGADTDADADAGAGADADGAPSPAAGSAAGDDE